MVRGDTNFAELRAVIHGNMRRFIRDLAHNRHSIFYIMVRNAQERTITIGRQMVWETFCGFDLF